MVALLLAGCVRTQPATPAELRAAEAAWAEHPVASYRTVVEVERYDERRRAEVTVHDGAITAAQLVYWDDRTRTWGPPQVLSREQAVPYTVPGLFDMAQGQLAGGQRSVRVAYDRRYRFPIRLELGNVIDGGQMLRNTDVTVRVVRFTALNPSP
ncbi:MAG: DUF6174 domain-containing protein [Ardenticatenaceae bacterium]|nr:DUF6174 domain-containing protein [Ardenticatenaceae bacterium]